MKICHGPRFIDIWSCHGNIMCHYGFYLPLYFWAQLFEGQLALKPGLNLTRVSFSFAQKHFLGQFSLIFIKHWIINLLAKRNELNLLYKPSYLNSNFALTLGYLNPALNNLALGTRSFLLPPLVTLIMAKSEQIFSEHFGNILKQSFKAHKNSE